MGEFITRDEFASGLDNVKTEVGARIDTTGVQIGAVEAILTEKLKGVKVWGALALVGGQVVAGLVAAFVGPQRTVNGATAAARAVGHFVGLL